MAGDVRDPTDPQEWLRRARSNLARANSGRSSSEVLYEDLAFDAQQAAEKAIKAVLVHVGVMFPRTHALVLLFDLIESGGCVVPLDVREAARLTVYAVEARYPGGEDVTEQEYAAAVEIAKRVVRWAEELLDGPSGPQGQGDEP
jgi:HEPN domain-containing protein